MTFFNGFKIDLNAWYYGSYYRKQLIDDNLIINLAKLNKDVNLSIMT